MTGGLRYTHEDKDGFYNTTVSGGPATSSNARLGVLRSQRYRANDSDGTRQHRVAGDRRHAHVTVQAGNSGLILGTPSDPRTIGGTLRFRS